MKGDSMKQQPKRGNVMSYAMVLPPPMHYSGGSLTDPRSNRAEEGLKRPSRSLDICGAIMGRGRTLIHRKTFLIFIQFNANSDLRGVNIPQEGNSGNASLRVCTALSDKNL